MQTLAGYYQDHSTIWDIGCDHGLLGLSFVDHPRVQAIHLVDPSLEVIKTLQNKLIDAYISKAHLIHIHHQKGQELTLNPESKTIFIAGMGGKEIEEILAALSEQLTLADRVVISPHRNILQLRESLHSSSFRLVEEISLKEDNQFYQILCLSQGSQLPKVPLYGVNVWKGEVGEEYRQQQLNSFSLHQDPLSRAYVDYLKQASI